MKELIHKSKPAGIGPRKENELGRDPMAGMLEAEPSSNGGPSPNNGVQVTGFMMFYLSEML